jgi:hypothetical protein
MAGHLLGHLQRHTTRIPIALGDLHTVLLDIVESGSWKIESVHNDIVENIKVTVDLHMNVTWQVNMSKKSHH